MLQKSVVDYVVKKVSEDYLKWKSRNCLMKKVS